MLKNELIIANEELKKANRKLENQLKSVFNETISVTRSLLYTKSEFKDLIYTTKGESLPDGYGKKEYGYWINNYVIELYNLVKLLGGNSILDLGCGLGDIMRYLKILDYKISVKGYDNEKVFVDNCKISCELKDVITLQKKDVDKFDILYFWEPLHDKELATKFVLNLVKIMPKGQTIIYLCAGYIGEILEQSKSFSKSDKLKYRQNTFSVEDSPYKVYIKN